MLRTVLSCVAYGPDLSECPWRRLVKIKDDTGKSARTMRRPATARTLSPLASVTLRLCSMPISRTAQMAHWVLVNEFCLQESNMIRGSIVVSISACHAEDPGSIPDRGDFNCTRRRPQMKINR